MKHTLIFLHGGPGFKDYLKPYFEALTNNYNCIFYDQFYGPDVTLEKMLTQLDTIVNSSLGNITLIGHPWGAVLAVEYAAINQNKLSSLVIMSTGLNHKHWKDEFYKELDELGLKDVGLEQIFLTSDEFELGLPFLAKTEKTFSEETFNNISSSFLKNFNTTSLLSSIKIPILNIFGEKDIRFPTRVTKSFRSFNQNILDFEILDAGHFPFLKESGRIQIYKIFKSHLQH